MNKSSDESRVLVRSAIKNFAFLKDTERIDQLYVRSIPLKSGGCLLPVCRLHVSDDAFVAKLTRWRTDNAFAYPTQFVATEQGTRSWLTAKLLDVEDRMLFIVADKHGNPVGHLGFANCAQNEGEMEIDNVVRGEKLTAPGIMSEAMQALMGWAMNVIGSRQFILRVFDDNERALNFYRRHGYVEEQRTPLRKKETPGCISYVDLEQMDHSPADKHFIKMRYVPDVSSIGKSMILTAGPSISGREEYYAWNAARRGWNREWSGYLTAFEQSFAQYVGAKYAMACSSCTGALHIALLALDIGPGDEVIVPDETWVATANAVRYTGATPVFADIEFDTWNLDPISVEGLISISTRAIIPVHMYGHPARMDKIMDVARRHNLHVVEDAAPAIGAEWGGQRCGSFGSFGAFSFQGAKLLVTGEGGMLVTNDGGLYEKALKIWDQGRNPKRAFWIDGQGVKYKMSNVQAAIGLGQLERCDELIHMKRRLFSWYEDRLGDIKSIRLNREVEDAFSIYWMTSLFLFENAPVQREELMSQLKARNIDSRPVFPSISQYPIWGREIPPQPVAKRVGERALNLPSGVCLSEAEVDYVCSTIRSSLNA